MTKGENKMDKIDEYTLTLQHIVRGGNLSVRFDTSGNDSISQLGQELNLLLEHVSSILQNVSNLTTAINNVSLQVISSISEQNSIANQQASSVAEITSTMEELSATSRQISMNASSVLSIAKEGVNNVEHGVEGIENLKRRLEVIANDNQENSKEIIDLGKKSNEISKVMDIINGIADQTKLIAFNAALEAASAGEAGKRFGIVAVEIRRLADNVMESTKDIAEKIENIQETVHKLVISSEKSSKEIEYGVDEGVYSVKAITEILNSAHANADAAKQISTSTQQQETASSQVVMAIKEISIGAKSNMKSVEELSGNIDTLANMANNLEKTLTGFQLGEKLFDWNEIYTTSIKSIDKQHKNLLGAFDSLHQSILKQESKDQKLKKLEALIETTQSHFNNEETIFKKHKYPEAEKHVDSHNKFIDELNQYKTPEKTGKYIDLQLSLLCKEWLNSHILSDDKQYVPFLTAAGVV